MGNETYQCLKREKIEFGVGTWSLRGFDSLALSTVLANSQIC